MAKFKVFQDADYVQGHLRYGHREGIIEADSKDDALNKLKNEGYTDYLDLVVDDYSVYEVEYGDNEFEIEEILEENVIGPVVEQKEKIIKLIDTYAEKHKLAKALGSEYINQDDKAQVDAINLVGRIFDLFVD